MNSRLLACALLLSSAAPLLRATDVEMTIDVAGTERKVLFRLDQEVAPKTSENFAKLCREGFYDGISFHRVIPGYVVQGGDPLTKEAGARAKWGTGGPGYTIPAELGGKHVRGALAASRLGDQANPKKESSGSQFYVVLRDIKPLDGQYTVFGRIVSGLEAFEEIASAPSDESKIPTASITIKSTRVIEAEAPAIPDLTATEAPVIKLGAASAMPPAEKPAAAATPTIPSGPPASSAVAAIEGGSKAKAEPSATPEPQPDAPEAAKPAVAMNAKADDEPQKPAVAEEAKPAVAMETKPADAPAPAPASTTSPDATPSKPLALNAAADAPKPTPTTTPEPKAEPKTDTPPAPKPEPAETTVAAAPAPMTSGPAFSPLSLNDAAAASPAPAAANPAPAQPASSGVNIANALAEAMRATPAPDPTEPPPAITTGNEAPTGFNFGTPGNAAAPAPAPQPVAPAPPVEDRMTLNTERPLSPMRLEADGDTLARATAALGGEAGNQPADDGFMPLSSVGTFGNSAAKPAPAQEAPKQPSTQSANPKPAAKPAPKPAPPAADPDPLAFPTFRQGAVENDEPAPQPSTPTPGMAAPSPEADPLAAPIAGPETPAAPPQQAAPEKPRGPLGRFIRRIW